MMEECFARREIKFLLPAEQEEAFCRALAARGFLRLDYGSPRVRSLYYDSADYQLIRASLERPAFKEKLRLRTYGEPGGGEPCYLEIKRKLNGLVYKRRVSMPAEAAMTGLAAGMLPAETGPVGSEALWMLRRYGLRPAALIGYDRSAYASEAEPNVRFTLDSNLYFRAAALSLDSPDGGLPLAEAEVRLLEVKTGASIPLWICRLLENTHARRTHFSKYGTAYVRYLRVSGAQSRKGA